MKELFEPQKLAPQDVRITRTIVDRSGSVDRFAGKRYHGVCEDRRLGFRISAEGDSEEEVHQTLDMLQRNLVN